MPRRERAVAPARDTAIIELRGPWQRSLRWAPERHDPRWSVVGIVAALVLTLVALKGFDRGMQWRPVIKEQVIQVSLIDPTPPTAIDEPPPPEPAPLVTRPSRIRVEPPAVRAPPPPKRADDQDSNAMHARMGEGASASGLFHADGRVRLPQAGTGVPRPVAKTRQQQAEENWQALQQRSENPLDCQRTRFAQAFRKDQSAGDAIAGKYLKWIGLANQAAIAKNLEDRERRAADGCDPPK